MKQLIDNLIQIYKAAVVAGRITLNSVRKGIHNDPALIPLGEYPYIAFDDGGQKVEDVNSNTAQRRIFTVLIEIGVYALDLESALDLILDTIDACKAELESESNRSLLYDSHVWAISMTPFAWGPENQFFRGVQIACNFLELEPKFNDY